MTTLNKTLAILGLLIGGSVPSFADIALLSFTAGDYSSHGFNQTVGWEFQVNTGFSVGALYWYAPTLTSDSAEHEVAIWKDGLPLGSAPLVQACVGLGCASSTYGGLPGYWGTNVAPTFLAPGRYVIGGLIGPRDNIIEGASSITTNPLITYMGNRYSQPYGTTLTQPNFNYAPQGAAYFGPNLAEVTPEPAFYCLLGLGIFGLLSAAKRKKTV